MDRMVSGKSPKTDTKMMMKQEKGWMGKEGIDKQALVKVGVQPRPFRGSQEGRGPPST